MAPITFRLVSQRYAMYLSLKADLDVEWHETASYELKLKDFIRDGPDINPCDLHNHVDSI